MNPITIYSKNNCTKCKMTKKFCDQHNIPYKEINIEANDQSTTDLINMLKETYQAKSMPVVVTDTTHWSDYRLDQLKTLALQMNDY